MTHLTTDNWIQIIGIIASFTASTVSVTIAVLALLQTRKAALRTKDIAFNESRPYVTIYMTALDTGVMSMHKYLVIKNFGKSAANISSIIPKGNLDKPNQERKLASLKNFVLAPGMSVRANVNANFSDTVIFEVMYTDANKNTFNDTFSVNFGYGDDLIYEEASKSGLPDGVNEIIAALNIIAQQLDS
ncbi:hypothetical protein ACRYI5_00935 [Furfurilactobacillus sp. WILCCON 0119]